jgi:hypothetical protein
MEWLFTMRAISDVKNPGLEPKLSSTLVPKMALTAGFLATYMALTSPDVKPKEIETSRVRSEITNAQMVNFKGSVSDFFAELYVKESKASDRVVDIHEPTVSDDGIYLGNLDGVEEKLISYRYDPDLDDVFEVEVPNLDVPNVVPPLTKNDRTSVRNAMTAVCFDNSFRTKKDCNSHYFNRGLEELMDAGVFDGSLVEFALGNDDKVEPEEGMRLLWNKKVSRNAKSNSSRAKRERDAIKKHQRKMRKYDSGDDQPGTLERFAKDIKYSLSSVEDIDIDRLISVRGRDLKDDARQEVKRFMDNVFLRMNANIMLGYAMTEIMPRDMDVMEDGKSVNKKINGVGKAYILDSYLKLGEEFVANYPAIWDSVYSYGPFQFTTTAVEHASALNRYVPEQFRLPDFDKFDGLQDHANASVLFAYTNWLSLGIKLANKGQLGKMNEMLEGSEYYASRAFIAGVTGAMHHLPGKSKDRVRSFVRRNETLDVKAAKSSFKGDLGNYFDITARAYMAMEVYRFSNMSDARH